MKAQKPSLVDLGDRVAMGVGNNVWPEEDES